jgi:hypothetical protein
LYLHSFRQYCHRNVAKEGSVYAHFFPSTLWLVLLVGTVGLALL